MNYALRLIAPQKYPILRGQGEYPAEEEERLLETDTFF